MNQIRMVASTVPGCGRGEMLCGKTGLRYHVDLHLEVDPKSPCGNRTRSPITCGISSGTTRLGADVLVHVEPAHRRNRDGSQLTWAASLGGTPA